MLSQPVVALTIALEMVSAVSNVPLVWVDWVSAVTVPFPSLSIISLSIADPLLGVPLV